MPEMSPEEFIKKSAHFLHAKGIQPVYGAKGLTMCWNEKKEVQFQWIDGKGSKLGTPFSFKVQDIINYKS